MSRKVRLAYLAYVLHRRMVTGVATPSDVARHFRVVVALDRECQTFRDAMAA